MINYILDSSFIIRNPQILNINNSEIKIIVPKDVALEIEFLDIQNGNISNNLTELINTAVSENLISLMDPKLLEVDELIDKIKPANLSTVNRSILSCAMYFRKKGEDVKVCINNSPVLFFCKENKIQIIDKTAIKSILARNYKYQNIKVQEKINAYNKNEKTDFFSGIFWGVVITICLIFSYEAFKLLLPTYDISIFIIMGSVILGLTLFWFRERYRLVYGVIEFSFAIFGIFSLFIDYNFSFSKPEVNKQFLFQFIGSLYIMVRGQDNIVKSLKETRIGFVLRENFKIGV